jgi:hypothetical protein
MLVPPAGFEPAISTLKGWRPRPLDYGGIRRARLANPMAFYGMTSRLTNGEAGGPRPVNVCSATCNGALH